MILRPYTIEITSPETGERIDFGPRRLGDIGRDILVVKRALGAIIDYQSLIDEQDPSPALEDPDGWFDCITGTKVSKLEAATFDNNMQSYLKKFQIENQFYILSYLFTKYTVNLHPRAEETRIPSFASRVTENSEFDHLSSGGSIPRYPTLDDAASQRYVNSTYVSTQIDLLTRMFEMEFGTLGEATLAVLHGWLPRSALGVSGYYHDELAMPGKVTDVTLLGIFEALVEGLLTQKLENSPDIVFDPAIAYSSYIGSRDQGSRGLRIYRDQAPQRERVKFEVLDTGGGYTIEPSHFGVLTYRSRSQNYRSVLYTTSLQVSVQEPRETSLFSKASQSYKDSLRTSFEPNPLVDPDPFFLDSDRICVYDVTEYTLENLPPIIGDNPSDEQLASYGEAITRLEDKALTKALEFYGKPTVWFYSQQDEVFSSLYGSAPLPNHIGAYTSRERYSLSTDGSIERFGIQGRNTVENYRKIEFNESGERLDPSLEPLIKFEEFRTPSLRPGDNYRAKFIINREKFDFIVEGVNLEVEEESGQEPGSNQIQAPLLASCEGSQVSLDDQERRYEEYRALASQKKREIARTIREKTLENYNNKQSIENSSIDLGVFGNTNLTLETDSYEFTTQAINSFTSLFQSDSDINPTPANLSNFTELTITFDDLSRRVLKAGENLKKAFENCRKKQIKIKPADFNANSEASRLQRLPGQLRKFITKRNKGFNFGTDLDTAFGGGFQYSGLSEIKFEFQPSKDGKGLEVKSLKAGGKVLEIKNLKKEATSLRKSRTVGYLAQLVEMTEGSEFAFPFSSACESLGIGKKGLAYIMKHTLSLSGQIPDEVDPINEWLKSETADPYDRWKKSKSKNTISNALKLEFGSDEVLSVFGNQCKKVGDFFDQFGNKFSITSLLCNYLKCIKLPAVNFTRPNFKLPPEPDFRIFGWYAGLIDFLYEKWNELLAQFLCAFAKKLLDILTVPFCQEQLRDQLYGSGSQASPEIQRALVDGLTDLSIRPENVEKSKKLIDEMALFLTGEELCRVLQGEPIDAPTMNMILRLAERLEIDEVDTEETLRSFFETISIFLPEEFCENLNQATSVIGSATCAETSSYLDQIRRRMLASEATDEEIDQAVAMARENLMSEAEAFQALGESGLEGLIPPTLEFGSPDALISELPEVLSEQIDRTAKSLFESAKMGYVSSLSEFGPALSIQTNRLPAPTDPEYNEESAIVVQTILENLRLYARTGQEQVDTEPRLTEQLHILYQIYELEEYTTPGGKINKAVKVYAAPLIHNRIPQTDVTNFTPTTPLDRVQHANDLLFLNPRGFLQNGYYSVNESGAIINPAGPGSTRPAMRRLLNREDSPLNTAKFNFIGSYKVMKRAAEDETLPVNDGEGSTTRPSTIEEQDLLSFLREKIAERLRDMQAELQLHLRNITTPIAEDSYLKYLKDFLDSSFESERERQRNGYPSGELVDSTLEQTDLIRRGKQTINLELRYQPQRFWTDISLYEFESTSDTNRFDPYTIEIRNSPLFLRKERFEYCDTIPGPGLNEETITQEQASNRGMFQRAISEIPENIYTRKELFARKFWESVKEKVDFIHSIQRGEDAAAQGVAQEDVFHRQILNNYLENFLRDYVYGPEGSNYAEGIFEQILFSLRDSRIYDEENYYPELKSRVNAEAYFSKEEDCYKNRYNVSQFGILSFEKMITDELANQINKELAKPENSPYNIDFDDPSPIEKAIQNVSLIGFVRVCIIELILKGSLAYSVWDVEAVSDEPFMQDFVLRFVKQELNRHESISDKWEEIITRVTGIEQPAFALRDLVQKQLIKVQGVSKKIFQNPTNLDYYNWFIKYFVPQTEVSRNIANRDTAGIREGADRGARVARDPATGRIFGPGYQGQVVSDAGSIIGERIIEIEDVPDKFFWDHPLLDSTNVTDVENSFNELRDPLKLSSDLLNGNNPFFHIEHCIEVMGPLAHLETLILPGRDIVDRLIDAQLQDGSGGIDEDLLTNVLPLLRTPSRLTIRDSFTRFTNIGDFPDPADYSILPTPILPENARGSTVEEREDLNFKHEIYHIDDFIGALDSLWTEDDLEKFLLHLRGLMHYDPDAEAAPGGLERNTLEEAANAYPETIRRTPTRFITRKRRVLEFAHDFVSHNQDALFEPSRQVSLATYHDTMNRRPIDFMVSPFGDGPELAAEYFEGLKGFVTARPETTKYYILPSNGEEILHIRSLGLSVEEAFDDGRFQTQFVSTLGVTHGIGPDYKTDLNPVRYDNIEKPSTVKIQSGHHAGGARNIRKQMSQPPESLIENLDSIQYQAAPNPIGPEQTVFQNPIGTFESQEDFEVVKDAYGLSHEETWVETVFSFFGEASIIAGLHGSFSIGETFDPAVLNFEPSQQLKDTFNNSLRDLMGTLGGDQSFANAEIRTDAETNYGTKDPRLSQYGRVFFTRQDSGEFEPFLARPMGLDRFNNEDVTKHWTVIGSPDNLDRSFQSPDFSPFLAEEGAMDRGRKLVHNVQGQPGAGMSFSKTDLLPPNFYKIPLRVLLTQVYHGESATPSEVYCKVVPPKYIRDLHSSDSETVRHHIGMLNQAINAIAEEYVQFVTTARENLIVPAGQEADIEFLRNNIDGFPDFTTDFSRAHNDWEVINSSNVNLDSNNQWCSIERVYSHVFAAETPPQILGAAGTYNTEQELDSLFLDRGSLMIDRAPHQNSAGNMRPAERHYVESCNYFYQITKDTMLTDQARSNSQNFHKIIFSLKNVFQWYLRNRRSNTLWGAITAPQNVEIGAEGDVTLQTRPELLDLDGNAASPLRRVEVQGPVYSKQEFPLAQSYSEIFQNLLPRQDLAGQPEIPGYRDQKYIKWSARVLPRKQWHAWADPEVNPNTPDVTTRRHSYENDPVRNNFNRSLMTLYEQPGYVSLFPGQRDIDAIAAQAFDEDTMNSDSPHFQIGRRDLTDWVHYGDEGADPSRPGDLIRLPGLISDGPGYAMLNYNRIEDVCIRDTGTSLFYADGMISHLDISSFIKSSIVREIADSYDEGTTTPSGFDPFEIIDLDGFMTSENLRILENIIKDAPDFDQDAFSFADVDTPFVRLRAPRRFDPAYLNLDAGSVNRLVSFVFKSIENLYTLAANQAAFQVKSEASPYNKHIINAPYKLLILRRFFRKIKDEEYTPQQKLFLLALGSIFDFAYSLKSLSSSLDARGFAHEEIMHLDDDDIPEGDLEDWAVACLHWLGSRLLRGPNARTNEVSFTDDALWRPMLDIFTQETNRFYTNDWGIMRSSRVRVYRLAGHPENAETPIAGGRGDLINGIRWENVRHIGGYDDNSLNPRISWDNLKGLVRDINRHGLTPRQIIKKANALAFQIADRVEITDEGFDQLRDADGQARRDVATRRRQGEHYGNNEAILNELLMRNAHGDFMVNKYADRYRSALSRLRNLNRQSPVEINQAAFEGTLSGLDLQAIREGRVDHFLSKLDYRTFKCIFGNISRAEAPFIEESRWIQDQMSNGGLMSLPAPVIGQSSLDYYREMIPQIVYGASAMRSRAQSIGEEILTNHANSVDTHRNRWNAAFGGYSGITSEFLSPNLLRSALVNGKVVKGLLESSEINQVVRLVANSFIPRNVESRGTPEEITQFRDFVTDAENNPIGSFKEISEEFRSFVMAADENFSRTLSVPLVEYKKSISSKGGVTDCFDLVTLREDYKRLQPWMAEQLIETNEAKQIFQYIYPVKRFQAIATAFVTSALAGYSTMPSVLQTPKASLAALINISSMTRRERTQIFDNFSQGEFFKQMINNTTSNQKAMECFEFPYPQDFIAQFAETLEQLFKEFPSLFFRGIAEAVDPAYKEMKMHWENCDIDNLGWKGVQWGTTIDEKDMTAGLMGTPDGERNSKYSMIIPSAPVDIAVGSYRVATNPFSSRAWRNLGTALERTLGYIYKGPIALVDGAFSFSIPCRGGDGAEWPGSIPAPWNMDRYGHPLSPLTAIALTLPELKGEKRRRNDLCSDVAQEIDNNACPNSDLEESPFGAIDDTEEE